MSETAKQWSGAALGALGIIALVVFGVLRKDVPSEVVTTGIGMLAMRVGGLVTHALGTSPKDGGN